jgi:hypothetical protein
VFFSALLAPAQTKRQDDDGYWWAGLSPQYRLGFVYGYLNGTEHDHIGAMGTSMSLVADLAPLKWPSLKVQDGVQKFCLSDDDFDGITVGQFVDGIDAFYKDYKNKQLTVVWAMEYVRDAIKGKPSAELTAKLEMWRKRPAKDAWCK